MEGGGLLSKEAIDRWNNNFVVQLFADGIN